RCLQALIAVACLPIPFRRAFARCAAVATSYMERTKVNEASSVRGGGGVLPHEVLEPFRVAEVHLQISYEEDRRRIGWHQPTGWSAAITQQVVPRLRVAL